MSNFDDEELEEEKEREAGGEGKKEGKEQRYHERETVAGIEISVGYDSGYRDFTIYFPQIEIGSDQMRKEGIADQVIRIDEDPKHAKEVFEHAKRLANTEKYDAYTLYSKMEAYIGGLSEMNRSYHEKTTVNGIDISIGYDTGYDDFTIYFPQIEIGSEQMTKAGIADQVIRIDDDPERAREVYEKAQELAATGTHDPYSLYKEMEKFIEKLPDRT